MIGAILISHSILYSSGHTDFLNMGGYGIPKVLVIFFATAAFAWDVVDYNIKQRKQKGDL
jgi:hypothetical protein